MDSDSRRRKGQFGEELALRFLTAKGMKLLARNFRTRFGEIDLIMRDGEEVVFVEVRSRSSSAFGGPLATVGHAKQARIRLVAGLYLEKAGLSLAPCRFDVIGILRKSDGMTDLEHIPLAFC